MFILLRALSCSNKKKRSNVSWWEHVLHSWENVQPQHRKTISQPKSTLWCVEKVRFTNIETKPLSHCDILEQNLTIKKLPAHQWCRLVNLQYINIYVINHLFVQSVNRRCEQNGMFGILIFFSFFPPKNLVEVMGYGGGILYRFDIRKYNPPPIPPTTLCWMRHCGPHTALILLLRKEW